MVSDVYRFLIPILGAAIVVAYLDWPTAAVFFLLLALFVCYFFRNPRREIPQGENLIVSPADGKITAVEALAPEEEIPGGRRVTIFLSVFDVHVNRSPTAGEVESLEYRRGRFKAAFVQDADRVNEQNIITIRGQKVRVIVKQIAGVLARRVVCWKSAGNPVDRGELIGLIRFGSRVDVLLPASVNVLVKQGDRVKGGSSILGQIL